MRAPSEPVVRVIDRALGSQKGNLVAGAVLAVVSMAAAALINAVGADLVADQGLASLWLPLFMAIVSVPMFGAIVLFAAGTGLGFPDGLRYGVLAYIIVGVLFVVFGIPGQIPPGVVPAGPFWPFFVLWYHPCMLGFGVWSCPTA